MNTSKYPDANKTKINILLGLKRDDMKDWSIVSKHSKYNLYLLHFNRETENLNVLFIRGIIYNGDDNTILHRTYGDVEKIYNNNITLSEGSYVIGDKKLSTRTTTFTRSYDGTKFMVFLYQGETIICTNKSFNLASSVWGDAKLLDLWEELSTAIQTPFFEKGFTFSSFCYIFLVIHPKLTFTSKIPIGKGFIVYLGSTRSGGQYSSSKVQKIPNIINSTEIFIPNNEESYILKPKEMTIDEANDHLAFGYWSNNDPILGTGECVIATTRVNGEITYIGKVIPFSHAKREELQNGNDPNLFNAFVNLYPDVSSEDYDALYPMIQINLEDKPINDYIRLDVIPSNKYERWENIFHYFLLSLSPVKQEEAKGFFIKFNNDMDEAVKWMVSSAFENYQFVEEKHKVLRDYVAQIPLSDDKEHELKIIIANMTDGPRIYQILTAHRYFKEGRLPREKVQKGVSSLTIKTISQERTK